MDVVVYQQDQSFVVDSFRGGDFDYVDAVDEVEETQFFRYIGTHQILTKLAESYPSSREKEEVPTWIYIASNLSMRIHGVHSFHAYPYVVRCGGMLNAFGPEVGHKTVHPETKDVTLRCAGFNDKNTYDRQTPCDQDFLRKLARNTTPDRLEGWFNREVVGILKQHKAFDPEGIFMGDASCLFVPDNEHYEGSVKMLFDEHNHPVDGKKLTAERRARCQWKRCYKLASLIHTHRGGDFFLYAAVAVVSGKTHECPVLYGLVDGLVQAVGRGVVKRLILDRGFLNGAEIGRCKKDYGIDVLIPVRKDMDVYEDALGLMRGKRMRFECYAHPAAKPPVDPKPLQVPTEILAREKKRQEKLAQKKQAEPSPPADKTLVRSEGAVERNFRSWSSCPVPLSVIVNREIFADGHEEIWMLLDTKEVKDPAAARDEYHLRPAIEERHRQLKCFWNLTDFQSRALSLIVNQVIFVALAYSLLQLHLRRMDRAELNRRTIPRIRQQLMPTRSVVILYYQNRFALLSVIQYTQLLLSLAAKARRKVLAKTRQIDRQQAQELALVRAP
jgi:hypothetical protein